jgi:hypothetical protein
MSWVITHAISAVKSDTPQDHLPEREGPCGRESTHALHSARTGHERQRALACFTRLRRWSGHSFSCGRVEHIGTVDTAGVRKFGVSMSTESAVSQQTLSHQPESRTGPSAGNQAEKCELPGFMTTTCIRLDAAGSRYFSQASKASVAESYTAVRFPRSRLSRPGW